MTALIATNCNYCGGSTAGGTYCCSACKALDGSFAPLPLNFFNEYSYLDQANFRGLYKHVHQPYDYCLYVEGLHCSSCVHLLESIPEYDEGVDKVRVNYSQSQVALSVNEKASLAKIAALLKSWGYSPHFLKPQDESQNHIRNENKKSLMKLAVAGACAGNIMLFVIPIYAGLSGSLKDLFNWISFFLFLPIVVYSATSFYQGAWNSLRYRTLNVDLPITLAFLSGFIFSTVNLVRGSGNIYFDSTAGFIFLILSARFFLKRVQQKFGGVIRIIDFLQEDKFCKIQNKNEQIVSLSEIYRGDEMKFHAGQILPVDGTLISSDALIDVSILNGEPMPRHYHKGMVVPAGTKVLSSSIDLIVINPPQETHLASMIHELQKNAWEKSRFITLTDNVAQALILTVFSIAVGFFIFYYSIDPQEAFDRALALIVLACPCALAFGAPLTFSLAIKKAQKMGILIKNSQSFEKILNLNNVFFDKTGTLTEMELRFSHSNPTVISDEIKKIVISLEQNSYHPFAFAFRKKWPELHPIPVQGLEEELGKGVSGFINSHFYQLFKIQDETEISGVCLKKDGMEIFKFFFVDPLRRDSKNTILQLSKNEISCFLLSGDSPNRVKEVAELCGIQKNCAFSSLSPEGKRDIVKKYKHTCMIGDGSNDALALSVADVGIAVKGSTFLNMQAADIYFSEGGLKPVLKLLSIAKQTRRILITTLGFSLFYNFVGGLLALLGFISPLLAAVLMPLSSVLIVSIVWWGFR